MTIGKIRQSDKIQCPIGRRKYISKMNLITRTSDLEAIVQELSERDFITIDTEFIRETTFWPELCLVQLAAPGISGMIDPLADGLDLSPLWSLMANENVTKVFHAARQDIEIIFKMGNLIPHPVFDTQVAAMVCGFGDAVAYDQLVRKVTGAHIDKSSRFTDWRRRPLTEKQLEYALADVTHLIDVYQHLKNELEKTERLHWLNEEMDVLTSPGTYDIHPEDAWQRLKLRVRKPVEFAILKAVAAWRERQARERNMPRSRVLKDDAIYEIAQQAPRDIQALSRLRSIPRGWERSAQAGGLIETVASVLEIPQKSLPQLPQRRRSPEGTSAAAELLKVLLKMVAEEYGVATKILATSDDIDLLAAQGAEAEVPALHGWRMEVFGKKALELLNGEVALKMENRKVQPFKVSENA
jgi:ribonuclease D